MDASHLSSLEFFKPQYMSLHVPHPLWTTCGSNPYEICKAIVQAKILSGRYRTDQLLRHFTSSDGSCSICSEKSPGSITHLLLLCPALYETRSRLLKMLDDETKMSGPVKLLIKTTFSNDKEAIQMLVDCSVLPSMIKTKQVYGPNVLNEMFRFTRSWCYAMHKERLKLLGRWKKY